MSTKYAYGAKLVHEGMGGSLCPPGHPMHDWSVQTGRSDNPNGCYCLESAATLDYLPPAIRGAASGKLKRWEREKLPLTNERVQDWIAHVLGYFKGCYSGQNDKGETSWNAGDLRIKPDADPMLNADIHAGVHLIRGYYPEYTPKPEDFKRAYWGSKPEVAA